MYIACVSDTISVHYISLLFVCVVILLCWGLMEGISYRGMLERMFSETFQFGTNRPHVVSGQHVGLVGCGCFDSAGMVIICLGSTEASETEEN